MTRPFLICALFFSGCGAESPTETASVEPAPPEAAEAPPAEAPPVETASAEPEEPADSPSTLDPDFGLAGLAEVRAYGINLENPEARGAGVIQNDALNEDRNPADGVILTDAQVATLREAITGNHDDYPKARCFVPHHGFVFYSEDGEVLAHFSVCFRCATHLGSPGLGEDYINLNALRGLARSLNLGEHTSPG